MKAPRQNPFMRIIICVLLMLLSQTVAAFAVVLFNGGTLFAEGMTMAEADAAMLEIMYDHQTEILLVSHGVVMACLWFMAHRRERTLPDFTGLQKRSKTAVYVLAAAAGLAAAFWATIAVNLIPWPEAWMESYQTESGALSTAKPALDFLVVVLLGPLVEELVFRGVIYDAFCALVPAGAAVVFQGLLFGSIHGTLIWMLYAALMGCLIGYVRKRTDSLRPCILMHMAFNGAAYPFDWFVDRFGQDSATVTFVFIGSALVLLLSIYGISCRNDSGKETKN